jgi:hypothetical protein
LSDDVKDHEQDAVDSDDRRNNNDADDEADGSGGHDDDDDDLDGDDTDREIHGHDYELTRAERRSLITDATTMNGLVKDRTRRTVAWITPAACREFSGTGLIPSRGWFQGRPGEST